MTTSAQLDAISQLYINGKMYSKLDYLGEVSIDGNVYFHVYRRYNSLYEIIFVDRNSDFHFQRDVAIGDSIKTIMCLTDEQMEGAFVTEAISFKKNSSIYLTLDMRWSYLQHLSQGAILNVQLNPLYSLATPVTPAVTPVAKRNLFDQFCGTKRMFQERSEDESEDESEESDESEDQEESEEYEDQEESEEETPQQLTRTYLCLRNRRIRRVTIH